jgi:hypothetical protein
MKYYESNFDEYVKAVTNYNLHEDRCSLGESGKGSALGGSSGSNRTFGPESEGPKYASREPFGSIERTFPCKEGAGGNLGSLGSLVKNKIYYGGSGVGKYSQALHYISQFSLNGFVSRRICFQNEKFNFQYFASDVHYEIDMSLLGCNSKILWHELVQQIVDIMMVSRVPVGFIMCKNFHLIHSELLEIFYSYIQEYCNPLSNVQLRFILITEHVSFLPNNILDVCEIVALKRPSKAEYKEMVLAGPKLRKYVKNHDRNLDDQESNNIFDNFLHKVSCGKTKAETCDAVCAAIDNVSMDHVLNIKEINQLPYEGIEGTDVFNVVCDTIIGQMLALTRAVPTVFGGTEGSTAREQSSLGGTEGSTAREQSSLGRTEGSTAREQSSLEIKGGCLTGFRDALYDILIYNLDVGECLWYIYSHFVGLGLANSSILIGLHDSLKYFNNNYRPIYHLERIMLDIVKEYTRILRNNNNG